MAPPITNEVQRMGGPLKSLNPSPWFPVAPRWPLVSRPWPLVSLNLPTLILSVDQH